MMVPTKEFDQLFHYYKGEITDNALLNKAGRLAAESHVILRDKSIPDSIAIKKIKPLARQSELREFENVFRSIVIVLQNMWFYHGSTSFKLKR